MLLLNYWNAVLAFVVRRHNGRERYHPVRWYNGGWHQFHAENNDELIGFDSLPNCLMFLATVAEMDEAGIPFPVRV